LKRDNQYEKTRGHKYHCAKMSKNRFDDALKLSKEKKQRTNESISTNIDAPPPSAPQSIIGRAKGGGVHAKVRKVRNVKTR
jgi:hypothetical protein